jgi:hypothetical protein
MVILIDNRLLFLCSSVLAILSLVLSVYRRLGEQPRCQEREKWGLRAGDEASIRDAGSGHERTGDLHASSSHDEVVGMKMRGV